MNNLMNAQKKTDSISLLDFNEKPKSIAFSDSLDYHNTIKNWHSIEDVHQWIASNFSYDLDRAMLLANNKKTKTNLAIYNPEEFWKTKKGICVDVSRFAYESLKMIDSSAQVNYLKIEFEALNYNGSQFINHWLVSLKKPEGYYFFADSKRPKKLDGPYLQVKSFINKYEAFRQRKIKSYSLLDSYKKRLKAKVLKKDKS